MENSNKKNCFLKQTLILLTTLVIIFGSASNALSAKPGRPVLITEQEAALADAPEGPKIAGKLLEKETGQGPLIVLNSPKNEGYYPKPIKIDILFIPRGDAAIDLSTLKVIYVKIFNIDITARVKKHATDKGIQIPEVEIPSGKHKFKILLSDTKGNMSSQNLVFVVQ